MIQFVTLDAGSDIYLPIVKVSPEMIIFFVILILVVGVALMNLVTAIIVEGSFEQAKLDREVTRAYKRQMAVQMMPYVRKMFQDIDTDKSGDITIDEISSIGWDVRERMASCFETDDMVELFEMLDIDGSGHIKIDEFCDQLVKIVTSDTPVENIRMMKQLALLRHEVNELAFTQPRSSQINDMEASIADIRRLLVQMNRSNSNTETPPRHGRQPGESTGALADPADRDHQREGRARRSRSIPVPPSGAAAVPSRSGTSQSADR